MKFSIGHIIFIIVFFSAILFIGIACHTHDHGDGDGHSHGSEATDDHGHDHGAHDDHKGHDAHEGAHDEEGHEEEVALTKIQMQKIGLMLGKFEEKNLKSTLKVNGKLELPPQNKANVSSITPGKVTNIAVKPGQYVRKGATLATILNPSLIDFQQEYLEVLGALLFLDKEYERQKDLVAKEIAPIKQLEKVISDRAIAQAKITGLSARMKALGIPLPVAGNNDLKMYHTVTSPISGFVREIKVNTGIFIEPQQDLFEIVDNHHLHIDFLIFEKDLPHIKNGQIVTFALQSQPKQVMRAKVFSIGRAINEADRSISVHAEIIDDKMELVPGMYVEGRIVLEDKKVAALPEEAVTIDKGLYYIFVKEDAHGDEVHFKKIPVLKGAADLGYVEITAMETLSDSTEIVTEGAYFLMAETKKGEAAAGGHHH